MKRLVALALLAAAAPVVAAAQDSAKAVTKDAPSAKRDRNVITADELSAPERKGQSVYEAVRSLRPNFLNVRGGNKCLKAEELGGCSADDKENGQVHASVDGNTVVSIDELKNVLASTVVEIRLLSAAQAMQKFGGSARQGPVILVKTM
jgi:hypothetical protein